MKLHRGFLCLLLGVYLLTGSAFAVEETPKNQKTLTESEQNNSMSMDVMAEETAEQPTTDSQGRPILPVGEAGILIEQTSGSVLYESNSHQRMFPASTTKVMTCLLAVEAIDRGELSLEENVTVSEEMLAGLAIDGSSMDLKPEETVTIEQLLWGLMIPSGNDAAMALAFRIAGGEAAFVERMNARAAELGLTDTHFMNPHGLHDENHYTTAADMAKIAKEAMGHAVFRNIADIAHIKIPPTNKTEKERYYISTNGLLSAMRYREYAYRGATGIKTGRTTEAGNCLVSSASRDGMNLIGVLFGGKDVAASHKDSARMLDYGFEHYQVRVPVAEGKLLGECKVRWGKRKDTVTLTAAADAAVVIPKDADLESLEVRLDLPDAVYAPLKEGEEVAGFTIFYEGQAVGGGRLAALTAVERSVFWPAMAVGGWLWGFPLVRGVSYCLLACVLVLIFLLIRRFWLELKRQKRARNQRRRLRSGK